MSAVEQAAAIKHQLFTLNANGASMAAAALDAALALERYDQRGFMRAMLSLGACGLRIASALEAIPPTGSIEGLFQREPVDGNVINLDRPLVDPARDPARDVRVTGPYRASSVPKGGNGDETA